jgi:Family of unknown function (DUF5677)
MLADIMTTPIKEIIPREIPENVRPIINWFADSIDEMVNFGSNVLVWDDRPNTDGEENIPPTMLLRHFLDVIDSISILVREATGDPPKILARAAMEVMLYLEYLFEKDTYKRSMAFLVADFVKLIKTVKSLHPTTNEGKSAYKVFKEENLLSKLDNIDSAELDDFIASKEMLLKMPQFVGAYNEYKRLRSKGEKNIKWHRFYDGPGTIESLAKYLNEWSLYQIMYRKWSGSVHGSDIYLGKLMSTEDEGKVDIVQLRFIKDVQEVVGYVLIMSFKVFRIFVENRVDHRKDEYIKWYLEQRQVLERLNSRQFIKVD